MAHKHSAPLRGAELESLNRATVRSAVFVFNGKTWTIRYEGSTFSLRNNLGLNYIHRMLQHPNEEFHCLDLMTGSAPGSSCENVSSDARWLSFGENVISNGPGDAGPVLDAQAKKQYRRTIDQLKEELDDLRERGDYQRAAKVESDIEFLTREIARAVGLGGRERHAGSIAERARLNVTRAIRTAIVRISEHHIELGKLLENSIRTGSFCSYLQNPRDPIDWHLEEDAAVEFATSTIVHLRNETTLIPPPMSRFAFVGREAERAMLREALEQTRSSEGRIVIMCGPPGIGKTRTAREAMEEARCRGFVALAGNCYDRDNAVPFVPFVELFETALAREPGPAAIRGMLGQQAIEMTRLLPQLRRMFPDLPQAADLPPQESRRLLFNAVVDLLERKAALAPLLLLLEDLQWGDEGTLALLVRLGRAISGMRAMIIVTHRDDPIDLQPALTKALDELIRLRVVERIRLTGLPQEAVAQMIEALSGQQPSSLLIEQIYSNTGGNPLFVEELVRHMEQRPSSVERLEPTPTDLPPSLRVVIGQRLALVTKETRTILEVAAVIGRSFTFALLERATGSRPDNLIDWVEEAEKAGLILSKLEYPDARFRFVHELSAARCQRLHLKIAEAIEDLHPNGLEDHADDLAHHFWNAGRVADPEKTLRFLQLAGEKDVRSSAIDEAVNHFRNAMELLGSLPQTHDNMQKELSLQLRVGSALGTVKGWSAPEVGQAFNRATDLCREVGTTRQLFTAISGMAIFHLLRAELHRAHKLTQELLAITEVKVEPSDLVGLHQARGTVLCVMGEFTTARSHLERAISISDRLQTFFLPSGSSDHPGVINRAYTSLVLCCLGYPDQALERRQEAVKLIRDLAHPFTLTVGFGFLAYFHLLRREGAVVLELLDEAMRVAAEYGFQRASKDLAGLRGFALIEMNRADEGILQSQLNGSALRGHGSGWLRAAGLARLAGAYGTAGRPAQGLAALTRGLEVSTRTGERWFDAELHRLQGELLLQSHADTDLSVAAEAQDCFHRALEIARSQHAKWWELRAATSLARLLIRQNRCDEARNVLGEVYYWFTEGFDTVDLKESKFVLDELTYVQTK
jgi:tetratricopeptide (TPR) repeat protein